MTKKTLHKNRNFGQKSKIFDFSSKFRPKIKILSKNQKIWATKKIEKTETDCYILPHVHHFSGQKYIKISFQDSKFLKNLNFLRKLYRFF